MNFSMVDFNYFDVTIAAIVLILGIKGFMRGLIKEFFGLLGLVGGVYFATRMSGTAATFIDEKFLHLEDPSIMKLIGFLSVLILVWFAATMIGSIISKLSANSSLGFIDRILGFVVGGGKYFVIFALIVTALSNVKLVKDSLKKYSETSLLYPYLLETGSYIINLDPTQLTNFGQNSNPDTASK